MIVWGGYVPCVDTPFDDGAAFDPHTSQWRRIARSPLTKRGGHTGVWTGSEMLVWGHGPAAAAYNPVADRWRRIASPLDRGQADAFVAGDDVIVWSVTEASDGDVPTRSRGSVYSLRSDRWRRVDGTAFGRFGPVWTGRELIVPNLDPTRAPRDANGRRVSHGAYDPRSGRWRSIPRGPRLRTFEQGSFVNGDLGLWTGHEAIFWGDDALAFDPSRNVWRVMTEPPKDCRAAPAIWTGREMIVWGGVHGGAFYAGFGDGIAYTPPSDPTRPRVGRRSLRPAKTPEPWELDEFGDPQRFDYRCGVPG